MDNLKPFHFQTYIKGLEGDSSYLYTRALARLSLFARSREKHPYDDLKAYRSLDLPLELDIASSDENIDELDYIKSKVKQELLDELIYDLRRIIYIVETYGSTLTFTDLYVIKKICEYLEEKEIYFEKPEVGELVHKLFFVTQSKSYQKNEG